MIRENDLEALLTGDKSTADDLFRRAREKCLAVKGPEVLVRALVEWSNVCRNDCLYCGIRRSRNVPRYTLGEEEILDCCTRAWNDGVRTFVLQGGENPAAALRLVPTVKKMRERWPGAAITLSLGELPFTTYALLREAGANRYLLRHESADAGHYALLHPAGQTLKSRLECLQMLRGLDYQVGAGFMVGSPFQSPETLAEDLVFLGKFRPEMVGIGPFIPHCGTPFAGEPCGSVELTLYLLSLIRLMLPKVLLPATTALASLDPDGRRKGFAAGANVIMPNLSPPEVREKYSIYNHKAHTGLESADSFARLIESLAGLGFSAGPERGDYPKEL